MSRLDRADYTLVVSILRDKDVDAMLAALAAAGPRLIATTSSSGRALPAEELAERAQPYFAAVEAVEDPAAALARGGRPGARDRLLYLLADLDHEREERRLT